MESGTNYYYIVNCFSVQINKTIKVKGILDDKTKTLQFPDNVSWLPSNRLVAYKFTNYNVVNKIKLKPLDFYFDDINMARIFILGFYNNALKTMHKYLNKTSIKTQKNNIINAIKEIETKSKEEHIFKEWNMSYFEYCEIINKDKLKYEKDRITKP